MNQTLTKDELSLWMDNKVTKTYLSLIKGALEHYQAERYNGQLLDTESPYKTQTNLCLNHGRTEAFEYAFNAEGLLSDLIKEGGDER